MHTGLRTILHIDMDAFFAAVEQRDNPQLRGKPVVVGSPPDRRGVVSTASYEARKFGVHSALPSRTAYQRCPHAVFLPVDGKKYAAVSRQVMAIFQDFTPMVEKVSIDEAFLDIRSSLHKFGDAVTIARLIKGRIRDELQLTASVGVATNKFLAKLASEMNKPDGLTIVPHEQAAIEAFLEPLPVTAIWGVGKVTADKLRKFRIVTVGDLQKTPETRLTRWLGKNYATHLSTLSRGLDNRPVMVEHEEKSISGEETFEHDCHDLEIVQKTLVMLAEKVGRRLRSANKLCRTLQIKIRFADFHTITRQMGLPQLTASDRILIEEASKLFLCQKVSGPVRLIGFGVTNLVDAQNIKTAPRQPLLFPDSESDEAKRIEREQKLDEAVDTIRKKFGITGLRRGI